MSILKDFYRQAALGFILSVWNMSSSSAATYTDNINFDPGAFSCGYYGSEEICGAGAAFSGGPRVLSAGDTVTENVSFTSRINVPSSNQYNVLYVFLPDTKFPGGAGLPGPNQALVKASLIGYSGPPNPIALPYTYVSSSLDAYGGDAGFAAPYEAPNSEFSATGINVELDILTSDPNLIYGVGSGFAVDLPGTPQVLGAEGGSVGHPLILPSGYTGKITSNISGGVSKSQFYNFIWNGGIFQTGAAIVGANDLANFHFQLYSVGGSEAVEGVTPTLADVLLDSSDGFADTIKIGYLPAGDYEIGLFTDSPYDPAFTINFDTPVGSVVPEPSAWALLVVGFAALGSALRRRRHRVSTAA